MNKTIKIVAIAGCTLLLGVPAHSQRLRDKFKQALATPSSTGTTKEKEVKKPVLAEPYAQDISDETGLSGLYYSLDTIWVTEYDNEWKDSHTFVKDANGNPVYADKVKFHYEREKNDNVVNLLTRYVTANSRAGDVKNGFILDEKFFNKTKVRMFKYYFHTYLWTYTQIEPDVLVFTLSSQSLENMKVLNVYSKDQSKLDVYDKETALAKLQQVLNESKKAEQEAIKADLMKNETYVKMMGKVGFVTHYTQTGAAYGKVSEKPDVYISSIEMGKAFYWRAFYKENPGLLCSDGCNRNMIFEIDGQKVSYMELRKKSSTWSNALKKMTVDNDFFSMCPTMIENRYTSNWAFVYCLYLNKAKFADGKSFKCKVTITNYRDGVDTDVLSEGTINLVYKSANKGTVDELMKKVEEYDQ